MLIIFLHKNLGGGGEDRNDLRKRSRIPRLLRPAKTYIYIILTHLLIT